MFAALVALALGPALAHARTEAHQNEGVFRMFHHEGRDVRALEGVGGGAGGAGGCLYDGRWFVDGAAVRTRDACLRCRCARAALSCSRRACAPPPPALPPRCHLRHRQDTCCPEIHCPDGVTVLERDAASRLDHDDYEDVATPASTAHVCVEGGAVFAAGSALSARAACETCWCLGGRRRCVRARCLPAPPACRAAPAPAACCPHRYYCRDDNTTAPHTTTPPRHQPHTHDCRVGGKWYGEGARVPPAESACAQCFCLRGAVRCQEPDCAPALLGCRPLLRPGDCCPHQYHCPLPTHEPSPHHHHPALDNALVPARNDDRSLHSTESSRRGTTHKIPSPNIVTTRNAPDAPLIKTQHVSTTKVKRKTNDRPPTTATDRQLLNSTGSTAPASQAYNTMAAKLISSTTKMPTVETTEQPEGSVKIMINGTINCTAELSSTSVPLNATTNDTEKILLEAQPRVPYIGQVIEAQTSNPNDIITDSYVNGGFDENETFTINVTSSLRTNTSHSTSAPSPTILPQVEHTPVGPHQHLNVSKKTKEDYDYDYTEPTLPPSLPNLKIIPFVAADAVVDEDASPKEPSTYQISEREDKFPVYYPTVESKETPFATRREDVYNPTHYPVFVSGTDEGAKFPSLTQDVDLTSASYPGVSNSLATSLRDFTLAASLGSRAPESHKANTKPPTTSTAFTLTAPSVNLFSPPVETEGGFIPKGPGIVGEYYAVYPSTKTPPSLPHLTTSMQLDTVKESECVSSDGRRIREGQSVSIACSVCACAWGRLVCAPRPCPAPPGCVRTPATHAGGDLCCGELVCEKGNKTTPAPLTTTTTTTTHKPDIILKETEIKIDSNETEVPIEIPSELLNFDPPPDRSEPSTTSRNSVVENNGPVNASAVKENNFHDTSKNNVTSSTVANNTITPISNEVKKAEVTTINISVSTKAPENISPTPMTTTKAVQDRTESNETKNQSQEYEDEEEDEGFSFGSVLKLLLSDTYDTTKKPTTISPKTTTTTTITTPKPVSSTRRLLPKPTIAPFVPVPHHQYIPPKKLLPQTTVNRIDHLVLGEATAIKKVAPRPVTTPSRPITTSFKPFTTRPTSSRPPTTTRLEVTNKKEHSDQYTSVAHEVSRPTTGFSGLPGMGGVGGLLKLAGCNIYGRMYRVGRIITELSTPCEECRCTELGVQCRPLPC